MTKQTRHGGLRNPPGGRPKGSTKPPEKLAKPYTIRFHKEERVAWEKLAELWGISLTDTLRRSIREALERAEGIE